jgi:PKD repeat protein
VWVLAQVDLSSFAGMSDVRIRFANRYGQNWQVDDVKVEGCCAVPVADFVAEPLQVNAGESVQFYDDSTGDVTSWLWNFGDGNTSSLQHPSHAYAAPGTYTVSLTVGNECGQDTYDVTDCITVSGAGCSGIKGDINNDGNINSGDAILALRIAAGLPIGNPPHPADGCERCRGDVDANCGDTNNSGDAILILRKAAGLIGAFPCASSC